MSSTAEAELAAIFITAKGIVPLFQTRIEMKYTQGQSPTQTDNSTATGVTNNTIAPKRTKSMYMRFYRMQCHMIQGKFRF